MAAETQDRFVEYQTSRSRRLRNRLVEDNLELVEYYVSRYGKGHMEADDVRQQALMALIKAVERFDPEVGVTFKTFANRTIEGELKRLLRDKGWSVRPPRSLQDSANKLRKVMPVLTQDLGRTPSTADAAEHLGWTPSEVRDAHLASHGLQAVSVEALVGDGVEVRAFA